MCRRHAAHFFFMEENNFGGFNYDFHDTLNQGLKYGENVKYRDKQQQHEYGQQVALQLQSQEFAMDYEGKMEAMMKAGINPLTAAAGLASASTPAISSVPSTGVGQGVNAFNAATGAVKSLADAANAVTGGKASLADAAFKNGTLEPTIDKLNAEAATEWQKLGLTSAERQIAETTLKYADENAIRDLQIKRVNINLLSQQYKNLKATHDNIIAEYDKIIAQKDLAISQQEYYDALKGKTDEEKRWIKERNDFWKENGFDLNANGIHNIIAQMVANDRDAEAFLEKYIDYGGRYQSAVSDAEQNAIDKYAYSIAYRRQRGENVADIVDNRVGGWSDLVGRIAEHLDFHFENVLNGFKNIPKNQQGKKIRDELTMVLNNAYKSQEDFPNDKDIPKLIEDLQFALSLSNNELAEWYSKNWK